MVSFLSSTMATAGWAEWSYDFEYNNFIELNKWVPDDECKNCFHIISKSNRYQERTIKPLKKISIPKNNNEPLLIAQTIDDIWHIYNSQKNEVILSGNKKDILQKWQGLGFQKPKFINDDLSDVFSETHYSKAQNEKHDQLLLILSLYMILPVLLPISIAIFLWIFFCLALKFKIINNKLNYKYFLIYPQFIMFFEGLVLKKWLNDSFNINTANIFIDYWICFLPFIIFPLILLISKINKKQINKINLWEFFLFYPATTGFYFYFLFFVLL